MFWFAWKTWIADRGKALAALVGVVFSLVLVNIQGGLYLGLIGKASLLVDHCDADLWVGRYGVENVDLPESIPIAWINRIRGIRGVTQVEPYLLASAAMTLPNGEYEPVWIVGSDRTTLLGSAWNLPQHSVAELRRPDAVIIDSTDDAKLGAPSVEEVVEINGRRARVVAKTTGIQNFITTPVVFTTIDAARRYSRIEPDRCSYFLIRIDPRIDRRQIAGQISRLVPDAAVHTADQFRDISQHYWVRRTGIGLSFGMATMLGLLVGMLMVMQSLYSLVHDHLPEYAALKAIGAGNTQIAAIVCRQAVTIAAIGSACGVVAALGLQRIISSPTATIVIPPQLFAASIAVVFLICVASALPPLVRLGRLDPAVVLQG